MLENESFPHSNNSPTIDSFLWRFSYYEKTISSYNAHNNNDIQPGGQR